MKRIKFIISFLVLFIGMLIIGESHIFYLNNFYTGFYKTTLYLQDGTINKEMVRDILNSAAHNKVEVFAFITSPRSSFLTEINIYGTSGVEQHINENLNIFEQKYTSLFLGARNFKFYNLENIPGIENIHDFYLIGSKEQVRQFKRELINKYAGNFPKQGYTSKELNNNIGFIWLLIAITILLLSCYDVILQKKENLIKISMGEKISRIIWTNILLDSVVLVLIFIVVFYALSKVTYVYFGLNISLLLFVTLIFLNALLYLNLYSYNLKEVFSNIKVSEKLLTINYGLKTVTVIITIFIISSNVALIFESYSLYKQRPFFEQYADYYYTRLTFKPIINSDGSINSRLDETARVQEAFYRKFFTKFDATLISRIFNTLDAKTVLANKNAFDYLSSKIKELRNLSLNKDIYFLLPKKMLGNSEMINSLNDTVKFYAGDSFNYDYDIIYYDDNVNIVRIDEFNINGSELVKNPVIIYNNISANTIKSQIDDDSVKFVHSDYAHDVMYKITDEFNQFIVEHGLTNEFNGKMNVFEEYQNHWRIAKKVLYMNLIFSILVLFLEFIIISSIIKLEYEVNAIELSIKKVMGYSMLEKNNKIILITAITTILSILLAIIIAIILKLDKVYYLATGGIVVSILELSVIVFYLNKIENTQIQKILKGGNL